MSASHAAHAAQRSQPTCHELGVAQHPLGQEEAGLPLVAASATLQQVERHVQRQQAVPPAAQRRGSGQRRGRSAPPFPLRLLLPLLLCTLLLPLLCTLLLLLLLLPAGLLRCVLSTAATQLGSPPLQRRQAQHCFGSRLAGWCVRKQLVAPARLRRRRPAGARGAAALSPGCCWAQQAGAVLLHQLLTHLLPILLGSQDCRPQHAPAGRGSARVRGRVGRAGQDMQAGAGLSPAALLEFCRLNLPEASLALPRNRSISPLVLCIDGQHRCCWAQQAGAEQRLLAREPKHAFACQGASQADHSRRGASLPEHADEMPQPVSRRVGQIVHMAVHGARAAAEPPLLPPVATSKQLGRPVQQYTACIEEPARERCRPLQGAGGCREGTAGAERSTLCVSRLGSASTAL